MIQLSKGTEESNHSEQELERDGKRERERFTFGFVRQYIAAVIVFGLTRHRKLHVYLTEYMYAPYKHSHTHIQYILYVCYVYMYTVYYA